MTFPAFEGRGHANAMVAALTEIAESAGARPIAHTLRRGKRLEPGAAAQRLASSAAKSEDPPEDGLVWRWERPR